MAAQRFYVKIERDDGSRTYKGAWSEAHCQREADAWRKSFPTYTVSIVTVAEAKADVQTWARATQRGGRYYPPTLEAA